ncbi:MAG: YVTN family beta-propeller repeat-containing protein [Tannerella sp.]|jgi:YVTN family beta-propeller protein|nr:YVTN family beta-propeller repeat-containing protein [Tannerella sp.]
MNVSFQLKALLCCWAIASCIFCGEEDYLSPGTIAVDGKRQLAYTALTTARSVAVTDLAAGRTARRIMLERNPHSLLLSPDGSTLFVSCGETGGSVEVIRLPEGTREKSIAAGHSPQGLALSADGQTLYVANRFGGSISVIDLKIGQEVAVIPAVREPHTLCLTPDGKTLAAANFLPAQASTADTVAAQITLVDVASNTFRTHVTLPNGAQSLWGLDCSPDGRYLYCVHLISRYGVPITQLDRGWVNTNALSIVDLETGSLYAALLLDDVDCGAANPAGICAGENGHLYVALAGVHELLSIDMKAMHERLAALFSEKPADDVQEDLNTSLSFAAPFKKRIRLQGRSPRAVAIAGDALLVSSRFSPFLEQLSTEGDAPARLLPLGSEPAPDAVRRGELAFFDASICYQGWQSCVSCHPDGRADGLNWDQQNDGLGNPKNTKSLLFSHVTPPAMITGIRRDAETAVRNGILHTLGTRQPESLAADMDAYLRRLRPVESPFLGEYRTKDPEQLGKAVYDRADCNRCHNGAYLTDRRKYDVGTGVDSDRNRPFDTPTLREVWRTAPYLYDGRAATLREVFTSCNPDDLHGLTQRLTEQELEALILYIKTF